MAPRRRYGEWLAGLGALALVAGCGAEAPWGERLELEVLYSFEMPPGTRGVELVLLLPLDAPGAQEIEHLALHPEPDALDERDGLTFATYRLDAPPRHLRITLDALLTAAPPGLRARRGLSASGATDVTGTASPTGPERAALLAAEPYLEHDAPEIQALARRLEGADALARVSSAAALVEASLRYEGYVGPALGAAEALRQGRGDCTEQTDLLVALLRADAIPARHVIGFRSDGGLDADAEVHSWAEVWIEGLGFTAFDPLETRLGAPLDAPPGAYVALTRARNDPPWFYYRWSTDAGEVRGLVEARLTRTAGAPAAPR